MLAMLCGMAWADDSNWYVGADVGQTHYDLKLPGGYSANQSWLSQDRDDTAYNFHVGYKFSPYVALEGGYMDLGEYSLRRTDGYSDHASAKIHGVAVNALWSWPVHEKWSLFAKTGVLFAEGKANAHTDGEGFSPDENYQQTKRAAVPILGLGVSYFYDKNWEARVQYEDVGGSKVAEAVGKTVKLDASVWTVGINYHF